MSRSESFIFRRANPDDASLLADAERKCFSDPWSKSSFEAMLKNPAACFIIAGHGDKLIGYGGMTVAAGECDIINVAVMEEYRRRGVGSAIMRHMLTAASSLGAAEVFLEHRISNAAASALYDKLGFEFIAVRKKYYTSPREDAVVRRLVIRSADSLIRDDRHAVNQPS